MVLVLVFDAPGLGGEDLLTGAASSRADSFGLVGGQQLSFLSKKD